MYRIEVDGELFTDSRIDELAVISPTVSLEANTTGSFTMTIPPEHPFYNLIKRRSSIVSVYRDEEETPVFQGIAISEEVDFYKQKTVSCEGELTYLNDSVQRPYVYSGVTVLELLTNLITNHNAQVEASKRFEIGNVTVTSQNVILTETNYVSTLEKIKEALVDVFGGYIRVRYASGHKYIDYLADAPRANNQPIELGKNLVDYTSNIDDTEICTAVIPLGVTLQESTIPGIEERLTIKSVNDDSDTLFSDAVEEYGTITHILEYSQEDDPAKLKEYGETYLSDFQFENVVIEASAMDFSQLIGTLNRFELLDSVHVISPSHGMNRWFTLSKLELNLNQPESDRITLGIEENRSLTVQTNAINQEIARQISQIPSKDSILEQAKQTASLLIKSATEGFVYMVQGPNGNPVELLIMDKPTTEEATKVWRWNINGLGYSSTGYNGTYGTAITMDGKINCDFLLTGHIVCDLLQGGTIKLGGADNVNGQFEMYNAAGTKIGTWNKDGINVKNAIIRNETTTTFFELKDGGIHGGFKDENDDEFVFTSRINGNPGPAVLADSQITLVAPRIVSGTNRATMTGLYIMYNGYHYFPSLNPDGSIYAWELWKIVNGMIVTNR